jgi:hypothetical protein
MSVSPTPGEAEISLFRYAERGIMQSVFSVALLVSTLTSAPWPMATVR